MDLLGDIGTNDQLIATRSENEVLKQTVAKLTQQVQDLTIQLTIAQAEIDIYRSSSSSNDNPSTVTSNDAVSSSAADIFQYNSETLIGINNNINNAMNYCHIPKHILSNLHENSNPICISMIFASSDDDDDDNHSEHNLHTITIVTGGADSTLRWTRCSPNTIHHTNSHVNDTSPTTTTVVYDQLTAPVVCTTTNTKEVKKYGNVVFQNTNTTLLDSYVVVGTMDGHVTLLHCSNENEDSGYQPEIVMDDSSSLSQLTEERVAVLKKHDKYVSSISWIYVDDDTTVHHPQENESCTSWLATSSADGTIHIYTVTAVSTADDVNHQPSSSSSKVVQLKTRHIESFYFDNPVTCICYAKDITNNDIVLYVYVRNTPHIKVIRMPLSRPNTENSDTCCTISTVLHLNTSIYDSHVSFAVLDIKMSYDYKYLAVACDNHCHFIIENSCTVESQRGGRSNATNTAPPSIQQAKIIRKLYGHVADSYSRPIVAWSCNNQYVYCNTQNDTTLCIYSIASGKLLDDHSSTQSDDHTTEHPPPSQQPHVRPIKHMCSHPYQNILVTTSFDHKTIVWTPQEQKEEVL